MHVLFLPYRHQIPPTVTLDPDPPSQTRTRLLHFPPPTSRTFRPSRPANKPPLALPPAVPRGESATAAPPPPPWTAPAVTEATRRPATPPPPPPLPRSRGLALWEVTCVSTGRPTPPPAAVAQSGLEPPAAAADSSNTSLGATRPPATPPPPPPVLLCRRASAGERRCGGGAGSSQCEWLDGLPPPRPKQDSRPPPARGADTRISCCAWMGRARPGRWVGGWVGGINARPCEARV